MDLGGVQGGTGVRIQGRFSGITAGILRVLSGPPWANGGIGDRGHIGGCMMNACGWVVSAVAFLAALPALVSGSPRDAASVLSAPDLSYIDSRGRVVTLDPVVASSSGTAVALFRADVPDRYVRLRDGVLVRLAVPSAVFPSDLATEARLEPDRPIDRAATTWRCRAAGPEAALRASRTLWGRPGVVWALPDFGVPIALHAVPEDPYYQDQWYLRPGASGTVDVEGAWAVTQGAPQVVIAIVDTGVDDRHPDFGRDRFVLGWDSLDQDADPWPGPLAANAHGTHCAGIIGAAHNQRGVAGVCPGCRLMALRFLSGLPGDDHVPELSNAVEALHRAADDGAWVVSNSWGVYDVNKPKIDLAPLLDAARYAATHGGPDGKGALVIFSSGNQAKAIAPDDLAALPEVLSVGAVDRSDVRHAYSQYGPELDVVAPGGASWWRDPQVVTLDTAGTTGGKGNGANKGDGFHYVSAALVEARKDWPEADRTGEVTAYFNGTSSAAPIVAGIAGLAWSVNPALSAREVRRIIEGTADQVGPLPYVNGRNDEYGHGRANAGRAVRAARFGVDGPSGAACVEDVNCASGTCLRAPGATEGTCVGGDPPDPGMTDPATDPDVPVADTARPDAGQPADDLEARDLPGGEVLSDLAREDALADGPGGDDRRVEVPESAPVEGDRASGGGCGAGAGRPAGTAALILVLVAGLGFRWQTIGRERTMARATGRPESRLHGACLRPRGRSVRRT